MYSVGLIISDLKLKIPNPPDPVGSYSAYIFSNNLLFISGQLSIDADGKMTTGKIGKELNLEQGQEQQELMVLFLGYFWLKNLQVNPTLS